MRIACFSEGQKEFSPTSFGCSGVAINETIEIAINLFGSNSFRFHFTISMDGYVFLFTFIYLIFHDACGSLFRLRGSVIRKKTKYKKEIKQKEKKKKKFELMPHSS